MGEKTVIKRRKFNFLKFIIFIIFIVVFVFIFLELSKKPIKNIIIKGNNFVTDEEIIEIASLENYPSFIKTNTHRACKKIKSISFIKDCKISKKWGYIFEINIDEYKVLYKVRSTDEYILEDGKVLDYDGNIEGIPLLINYITDDIKNSLNEKLSYINSEIINKISEIEFSPTTYDDKRFILYMNDGNMVYITLTKIENLNKYNDIKKELEGKKGVLYLDSGNYFEIKE